MNNTYLLLNRLRVMANGRAVYDEEFHIGVNILRGKNHTGKSTICDLIFYVLGGENLEWTEEARQCEVVFAEINASGNIISLRREITDESPPAIGVCYGPLNETMKTVGEWSYYGRQRGAAKESFSQFMFDKIGLPQAQSQESGSNITMYQILRLLYGDQRTESSSLFKRERQAFADKQDTRRAIGEMLLGIDDLQDHELRRNHVILEKLLAQKEARFNSLLEVAEKTDPNFRVIDYSKKRSKIVLDQKKIEDQIAEASKKKVSNKKIEERERKELEKLQESIVQINGDIARIDEVRKSLRIGIIDSEEFIFSLESDLSELLAANKAKSIIGHIDLSHCPMCLSEIPSVDKVCCPLCKSKISGESANSGRLRVEQELKHQISESKKLLDIRKGKLTEAETQLLRMEGARRLKTAQLREIVNPENNFDSHISDLFKSHGYLTRCAEDYERLEKLQLELNNLEKEIEKLSDDVGKIQRQIKKRSEDLEARRTYCHEKIGDLALETLRKDVIIHETESLKDASGLVFSFEKDFISIRQGRLSASTQVFLKDSFYLALLKFSIQDKQCILPKFLILDNIEDKGMTPERFRNFHKILIDYSDAVKVPHQVILTTSYIDESLQNSRYCIGPSYNRPPYTLDFKGEWANVPSKAQSEAEKNPSKDK